MKKKGFTIIWLLLVIVLIGIIILVTIPVVNDIISNSKKESFRKGIEGIVREYKYKEEVNKRLGSVDVCNLQDDCKIEGTIKRDEDGNIKIYVTDGTYCTNGKIDNMVIINGTCGLKEKQFEEIVFIDQTYTKEYGDSNSNMKINIKGGSGDFTFTKESEEKDNIDSNNIIVSSSGMIKVLDDASIGTYNLVVNIVDNITNEIKKGNIKIEINKSDISEIIINDIPSVEYSGKELTPEPKIVLNGITLVKDVDYELSYTNNINVGEALVTITGIGNYVGSITKPFTINKVSISNNLVKNETNTKSNDITNNETNIKNNITSNETNTKSNDSVVKKNITITIEPVNLTYNGLSQSLIGSVNTSNIYYSVGKELNSNNYSKIGSTVKPKESEAGRYIVYYYVPASGNYNELKGSITSKINPEILTIPTSHNSKTYNENIQNSGIECPKGSSIGGVYKAVNAGTYTQTCILDSTNNYKWNDNTTTPKDISWVISKSNTASLGSCLIKTYTGSTQTIVSSGSYVNYSTTTGVNAGDYNIIVTSDSNHTFSDGTVSKKLTCVINPKELNVPVSPISKTYNGSSQLSGIVCPTGSNTSGNISAVNAGTYTQTCTLSSTTNYKWNDNSTTAKNISWVISKSNTATTGSCIARTYTGNSQTIVSSGSYVSYSTITGVNAGDYNITVTSDSNHTFSDGATSKILSCSIAKATPAMTLSSASGTHKLGENGMITATGAGVANITCSSSNTAIVSCSTSGNTITIVPVSMGVATLYITELGGANYNSVTKTYSATIEAGYRYACPSGGELTYDSTGPVCVQIKNATRKTRCVTSTNTCEYDSYTYYSYPCPTCNGVERTVSAASGVSATLYSNIYGGQAYEVISYNCPGCTGDIGNYYIYIDSSTYELYSYRLCKESTCNGGTATRGSYYGPSARYVCERRVDDSSNAWGPTYQTGRLICNTSESYYVCDSGFTLYYDNGVAKCKKTETPVKQAVDCPGPNCVFAYPDSTYYCYNGSSTGCGNYSRTITNYTRDPSTLHRNIFMGFYINSSNVIQKAYACYKKNNAIICYEGMLAEQYGGNRTQINNIQESNMALFSCKNNTNCSFMSDGYHGYNSNYSAYEWYTRTSSTWSDGGSSTTCEVFVDGLAGCYTYGGSSSGSYSSNTHTYR